jgi:hypothetical protein
MEQQSAEVHRERLEAIGRGLRDSGEALALLALGSSAEPERLDRWSDLDFFAILRPGAKERLLADLGWLSAAHPVAWAYRNTADGWKALFADGLFAEFALFEPHELAHMPFSAGRIVWQAEGFDASVCTPNPRHLLQPSDPQWLLGEALSNLFIGLGRWRRGERLGGMRLIQGHAVSAVLALLEQSEPAEPGVSKDLFAPERRFEARHPMLAAEVHRFLPGVKHCPEAAEAMLDFLDRRYGVPLAMKTALRQLIQGDEQSNSDTHSPTGATRQSR